MATYTREEFKGKVAIVTGAASGIGAATAEALAREGAHVVGLDLNADENQSKSLSDQGGSITYLSGDITSLNSWTNAMEVAKQKGGIDFLINIAGYSVLEDNAVTLEEADWQRLIDINLKGAWLGIKTAIPEMLEKGQGAIVNMSSAVTLFGVPNHAAYSMAKGGINALTRQVAMEYAGSGIRVNAVCPGPVNTPMVATNTPEAMEQILAAVPLSRIAEPEEVAQAILFLASKAAGSITGVILPIDGGMHVSM